MKTGLSILGLAVALAVWLAGASAEEYMKRGASVEDYEQALNRVMERKRGLVTGRERQPSTAAAQSQAASSQQPVATAGQSQVRSNPQRAAQPATPKPAQAAHAAARIPAVTPGADIYQPRDTDGSAADGLSIYFGYDSARLTEDAMIELTKLGQALSRPQFSQVTWLIEGHSDATGSEEYNQRLSEQRAQAAERYLVERCGIDPRRIVAVGKGERELYDPEHPAASVNRRVRLRPIGE